ncbi:glycosyltransferase family 25 protein [Rhodobacteraceae bacterium B1Z28]|uniref:Glycosyltransferase family 25 protein n=1 Tax=Ruegeria haliotis TaxID=2747601 RepID=A0ABX2PLN4_9RHOB|nr:glycosyltransferase family 25 protein [Ruegeria haliotis]NVO55020.1 glycosyltransferase family 25 protein [Ruegeria haliotis]
MGDHDLRPGTGIFYINLDRVPERRSFMEAQFTKAGLAGANQFSAIDGRKSGALDQSGYVPGTGSRWGLLQSEIACFESHRAVWQHVLDQDLRAAVVFEDDAEMSIRAGDVIRSVLQEPSSYDFVKLDYAPRSLRFGPEQTICGVPVRPMLEMAPSAAAYVVSREGCRKLLNWSREYSDHLDDFITIPRPDWRMYQVFPAVCVQMIWSRQQEQAVDLVKTSERTQDEQTNSGLDKGPLWFRVRRELHAARRKLGWRMGAQNRLLEQGGFVGLIPCADDLQV